MLNTNISARLGQRQQVILEYAVGFCIALMGGILLASGDRSLLSISIVLSTLVAYRYPIVPIIAHFLVFIFPAVLMKCFDDVRTWKIMFAGININDILLGIMIVAIVLRIGAAFTSTLLSKKQPNTIDFKLWLLIISFCLWFVYEIFRNFDIYGLSAAGEFRNHYLVLAVPVYVALFFDSAQRRRTLFKTTLLFCLVIPLLCIPFVGETKGWSIGVNSRFFPADISLGILQGLFFCFLSNKYGYTKFPPLFQGAATLVAILIILLDTHRSVWFSGIIMVIAFIGFDKKSMLPSFNKILGYGFLCLTVGLIASAIITSMLDKDLLEFITERSRDMFIFDDNFDSTLVWRMQRWNMEMEKIIEFPIAGLGFGGYWGKETILGTDGVSPHNLYVQLLVKLGFAGLLLYLAVVARIFQRIYQAIALIKNNNYPEFILLIIGMIALIGSHTYYLAYSFDSYSFFFIGLGMAAVRAIPPGTRC